MEDLGAYKQLDPRWHDWATVVDTLGDVALAMIGAARSRGDDRPVRNIEVDEAAGIERDRPKPSRS